MNADEKSYQDIEERIEKFNSLVDSIDKLPEQKKNLWRQIYANAMHDRKLAFCMYSSIVLNLDDPQAHSIHGPSIAKYLERMSKSNEQIIRLSELVFQAMEDAGGELPETINSEAFYDMFDDRSRKTAG